jgi:hypothetical protein
MSETRTQYTVVAKRWEQGWELHIEGVGVTQSDTLDDAELMARDLISIRTEVPADSFDVWITSELGGEQLSGDATRDLAGLERQRARRVRRSRLLEVLRGLGAGSNTHTRSGR